MSCTFSREALALHVEGDLSGPAAQVVVGHVAACADCRRFYDQLSAGQLLMKSLRHDTVSAAECAGMRREVMSIIIGRRDQSGWPLRIERTIMLGLRRRPYALAACALLLITAVSVLDQRQRPTRGAEPLAVFTGNDGLFRPEGYRDWIAVGPSADRHCDGSDCDAGRARPIDSVYINPSGFRGFTDSGRFPEGTLVVWEPAARQSGAAAGPHHRSAVLLAAVKDSSRFDGGWGFFDFSGSDGRLLSRAQALPESSGCRTCHRQDAETDHVFTQFYPVLRSARHGVQRETPRGAAVLSERLPLPAPSPWLRSPLEARI